MYIQDPLSVHWTPHPERAQPFLQNTQTLLTIIKLLDIPAFPRERTSAAGLTSAVWRISIIRASAAPSHSDTHIHTTWWLFKYLTLMQIKWWLVLGKAVINLWLEVGQMNGTQGLQTLESNMSAKTQRASWETERGWAFIHFEEVGDGG